MIKPASLRDAILAANTGRLPADALHLYIDKGTLKSTMAPGATGWAYSYTCNIVITDFADHPDCIFAPLIGWLASNEPILLQRQDDISFEVDILGEKSVDIAIRLPLTERVILNGEKAQHLPTPPYEGAPDGILWEIYLKGIQMPWPPA